ncbi:hypothetical protein [Plantactinospora sp. CA-290183]|uniref:hypothetical protein n=1 Tax=Plantactinospora sp. CA-290183 TaxID=3240006 RepID=UPI003D8FAF22
MDPLGYHLALGATERHLRSARPDAPIRPDPVRRSGAALHAVRRATAAALRLVADRLEPARPAASARPPRSARGDTGAGR